MRRFFARPSIRRTRSQQGTEIARERPSFEPTLGTSGDLSPVRIAHLTDLHFSTAPASRYPSGPEVLQHAVSRLNSLDLDAVLVTGDLFDDAESLGPEIPVFNAIMRELRHPWFAALGNHDVEGEHTTRRKLQLIESLEDWGLSQAGQPYYDLRLKPGVRLVVLDTTDTEDAHYRCWRGFFSPKQARWLDGVLADASDEVVLVALHHPPVAPFPLMDSLKFADADKKRLGATLSAHPNVAALLCGHFHMAGWQPFGLAHVLTGPGLIEFPHQFRTLEVRSSDGAIRFDTHLVPVPEHVVRRSERLRSYFFGRLSGGHAGRIEMVEGLWAASS